MVNDKQEKIWTLSPQDALKSLDSSFEGLTSLQAKSLLEVFGPNSIKSKKRRSAFFLFLSQFKNSIIIILLIATVVSGITGEWVDASIILLIVFGSAVLSFLQEYSAGNAIEKLRDQVRSKTSVLRDGVLIEVDSSVLVPGDLVVLSTGSLVPADGLILSSDHLFVNQSMLTGEVLPCEKQSCVLDASSSIESRINCVYMGTNVQNGSAKVLISGTGHNTEYGKIAEHLNLRPPETEFEMSIRRFGYLLSKVMLILTLSVFAINVYFKRPAIDSLLFSVALAVGITPQLLPAIISITLSMGSRKMAHGGVIVRRLNSIENFGSMDVFCTDKTGTLTDGEIRFDGALDCDGNESFDVLKLGYIVAKYQEGMANSIDQTILATQDVETSGVEKIFEIPFDFIRARMSVVVKENEDFHLITKGAFNKIISICSHIEVNGDLVFLDDQILEKINSVFESKSNEGIRLLGVAQKKLFQKENYSVEDESKMVFKGFLLLFDHPKEDILETIGMLKNKGVSLKILTGDNQLIAVHTAKAVGIEILGVMSGSELMTLSDNALLNKIEKTNLFVEVDPNQKERIIMAYKKRGHVVGYMGDGINDVPALHAADVSISVDNAVDVAKESADFVLMEKSLSVLNYGIDMGRTTFSNTLKYILVTTSANFGNMFSMAGASLFLPFFPLLSKQILMINFLTDFPAINIARDTVDAEVLEKPRRWDIDFIKRFMIIFGLISSIFDYLIFYVLFVLFKTNPEIFRSAWFTFSILTELVVLLIMRTRKPFFKSKPAPALLYASLAVAIITFLLPYISPINTFLSIEPVSLSIMLSLFILLAFYALLTEIVKYYFYKRN